MESKAYAQSYYIIQKLSKELKEKIPSEILCGIKSKIRKEDEQEMKKYTNIKDIELLEDTEKILSVIYTDYIATEEEKKIIINKEKQLYIQRENKKIEQYDTDIFKNKKEYHEKSDENKIIKNDEQKWYKKLLNVIKKIFTKNSI